MKRAYRSDDIVWQLTPEMYQNCYKSELTGDEVTPQVTVGRFLDWQTVSRAALKPLFQGKLVLCDGQKATPQTLLTATSEVRLQLPKEKLDHEPIAMDLTILYEDEDLLIVHKPVGITVHSEGQVSLANGIAAYFKNYGIKRKVRFLNRLDRDTQGCLVIAKSGLAQSFYQRQLETDVMEKWYTTVVSGALTGVEVVELPMRRSADGLHYEVHPAGKLTRTAYRALEPVTKYGKLGTAVDIRLYTGKTHQIRVAMAYLGHPLIGDALYGAPVEGETYELKAKRIAFVHMRTGERITVEAK